MRHEPDRDDHRIRNIVILGGGTAGWMSAAYLAQALRHTVCITVVEPPAARQPGVGKTTLPSLQKAFFDVLGIGEPEWMPACEATFSMGTKFVNWRTQGPASAQERPGQDGTDRFYHPFGLLPEMDGVPLSHYWFRDHYHGLNRERFDHACFREPHLMEARRSPRRSTGRPFMYYAWHIDEPSMAAFLRHHATTKQGVAQVTDTLLQVHRDADGFLAALSTKGGRTVHGDLFVDCTGNQGQLINGVLEEPFWDMSDLLPCDAAVAASLPYPDPAAEVPPYTTALAMPGGWAWHIPLSERFGTGYVYSSRHTDPQRAAEDLCRLWGADPQRTALGHVRFRVGRNHRSWVRNCVAIGRSSCFLEPLEPSGLHFITAALHRLVTHFPDKRFDPVLSERFNRDIATMYDDTRDFVQAHFTHSPRTDTPFWRAARELPPSDRLRERIALFKAGQPVDAPVVDEHAYYADPRREFTNLWTNGSYYAVLCGLGHLPDHPLPALAHRADSVARAATLLTKVKEERRHLLASLPSHRAFLDRFRAGGGGGEGPEEEPYRETRH